MKTIGILDFIFSVIFWGIFGLVKEENRSWKGNLTSFIEMGTRMSNSNQILMRILKIRHSTILLSPKRARQNSPYHLNRPSKRHYLLSPSNENSIIKISFQNATSNAQQKLNWKRFSTSLSFFLHLIKTFLWHIIEIYNFIIVPRFVFFSLFCCFCLPWCCFILFLLDSLSKH